MSVPGGDDWHFLSSDIEIRRLAVMEGVISNVRNLRYRTNGTIGTVAWYRRMVNDIMRFPKSDLA